MADFLDKDDPWSVDNDETEVVEKEVTEAKAEPEEGEAEESEATESQEETPEQIEAKREKFNPVLYREAKDERAKRQAAERQLEELKAQLSSRPAPTAAKAPDPYEDPDGYNDFVQSKVAETEWRMRAEMSSRFAEQVHGKEKVEAAVSWAQEEGLRDPTLGHRVQTNPDPVGYVVQQYERSRTLEALGGKSLDDYVAEQAAAKGWIVSQPGAPALNQKPSSPMPRKGLATAPGKGGIGQAPQGADWGEVKFALDR